MLVKRFLSNESGASSIDGTTFFMGLMGTGALVVATAFSSQGSGSIDTGPAASAPAGLSQVVWLEGFDDGGRGWDGGTTDRSDPYYGSVLGRFGGSAGQQAVRRSFLLPTGYDYAEFQFDLHSIDSWESESFLIFLDDVPVASFHFDEGTNGPVRESANGDPTIDLSIEAVSRRSPIGFHPDYSDQTFRVTLRVTGPAPRIAIGFGSTLDEGVENESWAIDDFELLTGSLPRA